ncbi:MAG TPA: ATP-binding cassette domain-containing protein, partial [Deinococcales bacterium]|nr:ATP-binding cassette domain-containing protein [Deinococcales bacterium]
GTYSTGMRKRLGLARALLHRPPLLFLDEPTNGLDPAGARQVLETLRTLSMKEETTILLCSHLLGQLTAVCDRYVFIREGALLESGSLPELRSRWQPGVLLEVLSTEPLPEAWEGSTADNEGTVSEAGLKLHRCSFMLPETAAVPAFLSGLANRVPLYGARLRLDSLEDIYFRIQELEP